MEVKFAECLIASVYLISPVYTPLSVSWGGEGEGGVVGGRWRQHERRAKGSACFKERWSRGPNLRVFVLKQSCPDRSVDKWYSNSKSALIALDDLALSSPLPVAQDTAFQHNIYMPFRSRPPL